jgi:DNA-binding SARP family transcriptional activator
MVEIRLLGRFSVRRGGDEIPPRVLGGRLVGTLLRLLATRRGEFVPNDALAEALWPKRLPADPRANLKVLVNRARRALGESSLIVTGPGGYSFASGDCCLIDAETFLAHAEAGRELLAADQSAAALVEFRRALEAWKGEPLAEDTYAEWAQDYRTRLTRVHLEALEGAATTALAMHDPVQAVRWAEQATAQEPLREAAQLLLVRALAASGDTAGALACVNRFRRYLAEELGLDPPREMLELETGLLRGQLNLALTRDPRPPEAVTEGDQASPLSREPDAYAMPGTRIASRSRRVFAIVTMALLGAVIVVTGARGTPCLPAAKDRTSYAPYQDRLAVKEQSDDHVYIVAGGALFWVPDLSHFYAMGYREARIRTYPDGALRPYTTPYNVVMPRDGTAIRDFGSREVYIVFGGTGFLETDQTELHSLYGKSDADIVVVPEGASALVVDAPPRNGTLYREDSSSQTFVARNGRLQPGTPCRNNSIAVVPYGSLAKRFNR